MIEIRPATLSDVDDTHQPGSTVPQFSVNQETVIFWPTETLERAAQSHDAAILV